MPRWAWRNPLASRAAWVGRDTRRGTTRRRRNEAGLRLPYGPSTRGRPLNQRRHNLPITPVQLISQARRHSAHPSNRPPFCQSASTVLLPLRILRRPPIIPTRAAAARPVRPRRLLPSRPGATISVFAAGVRLIILPGDRQPFGRSRTELRLSVGSTEVTVCLRSSTLTTPCARAPRRYAEPQNFPIGIAHSWSWAIGSSTGAARRSLDLVVSRR